MKKPLLLSVLFLISISIFAQQDGNTNPYDLMSSIDKTVSIPQSPEVAAFEKYGAAPVNLFSGTPSISIPIYTLKGHELSVPISLTYDASGIKIDQIATNIGLGWNLNFGGVVSRKVNHLADDLVFGLAYNKVYDAGFESIQQYVYDNTVTKFDQYHPASKITSLKNLYEDFMYAEADTQADTFTFNVGGLSGNIVIEYIPNGGNVDINAYCFENPDIKVSSIPETAGTPITGWKITNVDGTNYYFEAAEATWNSFSAISYFADGSHLDYTRKYNSAWYLTKIVSANGLDVFEFDYSNATEWGVSVSRATQHRVGGFRETQCVGSFLESRGQGVSYNDYKMYQFHLENIIYNGINVLSTQVSGTARTDLPGQKRITGLTVKDENLLTVLQVDFDNSTYFKASSGQTNSATNTRLKLDGVSIYRNNSSDAKNYSFDYILPNSVPDRTCNAKDYWGYYNGGNCSGNLYAEPPSSEGWPTYTIVGRDRSPSFSDTKIGSLQFITYPTGGKTEFVYEEHSGISHNSSYTHNGVVGGLRIKKTIDYTDGSTPVLTKYYFYNDLKAKVDDGTYTLGGLSPTMLNASYASSGKANQPLRFWEIKTVYNPAEVLANGCTNHSNYFKYPTNLAATAPSIVSYDAVTQIIFRGNSFEGATVTEFYNDDYNVPYAPNQPYINREVLNGETKYVTSYDDNLDILTQQYNNFQKLQITDPNLLDYQGIYIYDNSNNPYALGCMKTTTSGSNELISFVDQTLTCLGGNCAWSCSQIPNTIYTTNSYLKYSINRYSMKQQWKKLVSSSSKTYSGVSFLEEVTNFDYNSSKHYLTTEITKTDSKGLVDKTEVFYVADKTDLINNHGYPSSSATILDTLINRNQISAPIYVKQYYNTVLTGTQRKMYQVAGQHSPEVGVTYHIIRPDKIEASKGAVTLEDRFIYHSFDENGNPQEVSQPDGTKTYYIWGYHGKQLIAEIKNKGGTIPSGVQTLINTAVTASNNDTNSTNEDALRTALANLRGDSFFNDSQVTTFTYDPGIGLTSITDPRGYTMFYFYDQHNRLKRVEDKDGNIVGENEYNYRIN